MKKKLRIFLCMLLGMAVAMPGCALGKKGPDVSDLPVQMIDDKYRTFYEVFVYSFYDGNGDGIGDLQGLIKKLDYINDGDDTTNTDLGCNGIWLMPIMPATSYHMYDVEDYYDIAPRYGTMEDFEAFMAACEKRDIHVLIDLVINHTSMKHPWFSEACDYLQKVGDGEASIEECKYFGYYNFSKEKINSTWYQVEGTDWYYEASFWSGMPDLNLYNEGIRKEIAEITQFWLDKGVAGFRLDAAREYVSGNNAQNIEILTWLNDTVKTQKEDAYIVAEVLTNADTYLPYLASGIDSVFDFQFASQEGIIAGTLNGTGSNNAKNFGLALERVEEQSATYNASFINAPFYTNHDLARSAGYYAGEGSEEKTKIAQAMNLFTTGNAFLYYGEELGMKGAGKDENKRAPMQWFTDTSAAGMCDGPPYMDSIKMKFGSLEEQAKDENSVYNYVKDAIHVRNAFPEIARGNTTCLTEISNEQICVLKKVYEGSEIIIVYNLSKEAQEISRTGITINGVDWSELNAKAVLLTGEDNIKEKGETLTLPPYSVAIYK